MKVLILNGSPRTGGNTSMALDEMVRIFEEQGVETEVIRVGNKAIRGCIACNACAENGKCVFDDIVNETDWSLRPLFTMHPQTLRSWLVLTGCSTAPDLTRP